MVHVSLNGRCEIRLKLFQTSTRVSGFVKQGTIETRCVPRLGFVNK